MVLKCLFISYFVTAMMVPIEFWQTAHKPRTQAKI